MAFDGCLQNAHHFYVCCIPEKATERIKNTTTEGKIKRKAQVPKPELFPFLILHLHIYIRLYLHIKRQTIAVTMKPLTTFLLG